MSPKSVAEIPSYGLANRARIVVCEPDGFTQSLGKRLHIGEQTIYQTHDLVKEIRTGQAHNYI